MATSPPTDAPVVVLHVRNPRLARTQREGLRALGVEVDSLTPDELDAAMRGEAFRDPAQRAAIMRRITEARMCVLDTGTGVRLGAVVLSLRQDCAEMDYTTIDAIHELARGMALTRALGDEGIQAHPGGRCELIVRDRVLDLFRDLAVVSEHAPIPAEFDRELRARPPRPLPFVHNPDAFSYHEVEGCPGWVFHRVRSGHTAPRVLLEPGRMFEFDESVAAVRVLTLLVMHLPTKELALLETEEAAVWWNRLIEELEFPGPGRAERDGEVEHLLWHAMARDGGKRTLARLPAALDESRRRVVDEWDPAVRSAERLMIRGLASAAVAAHRETVSFEVLQTWGVVPCEDPLAPDVDPMLFRPTLVTLRVARRYRSAPLVLREALERWGGRPYLEGHIAGQAEQFVTESPPTSREELDDWLRLMTTLPNGSLRDIIVWGAMKWPRLEVAMVNLITQAEYYDVDPGHIPCFDGRGAVLETALAALDDRDGRQNWFRMAARWRRDHPDEAIGPSLPR